MKDDFNKIFNRVFNDHLQIINKIKEDNDFISKIENISNLICKCYANGNKVLLCGNGGSAADAQHVAAELIGRFEINRKSLYAESLSVNTSSITSIGNDYSFEDIFSRQVEGKGVKGDILIGITTSGTSKNIIRAFNVAKEKKITNICFTGQNPGPVVYDLCKEVVDVPFKNTARIQEIHIILFHIICEFIEKKLFS